MGLYIHYNQYNRYILQISDISDLAKKWKYYDFDNSGSITKLEIETRISRLHSHADEQTRSEMIAEAAKELMGDLDVNRKFILSLIITDRKKCTTRGESIACKN
jgi:Ca2+-binding EF-hand superfamily protein